MVRTVYFSGSISGGRADVAHYGRIVEPNHLQRSLDILHTLPRLDDPTTVDAWLNGDNDPPIDTQTRERLFQEWFQSAYEENAPEAGD